MAFSRNWIEEWGKRRQRQTGLQEVFAVSFFGKGGMRTGLEAPQRRKPEGEGEDAGRRRLAGRAQSMRSGEGGKNEVRLLD